MSWFKPSRDLRLPAPIALVAACALLAASAGAWAQEVGTVSLDGVPPDLIEADASRAAPDLGETRPRQTAALAPALMDQAQPSATLTGSAVYAAHAARDGETVGRTRRPPATGARAAAGQERVVFERQPIVVRLPLETERLITLPAPAALHVPSDMAQVARIETIDRTIYATALTPFTPIRIVAELIDSGQQIPLDLVANDDTSDALSELEVFVVETATATAANGSAAAASAGGDGDADAGSGTPPLQQAQVDMVDLTRHAARQLYAPPRLAWATPGVSQVAVDPDPVPQLIRGADVEVVPMGQWRGGSLYVTAVRVTNKSRYPLEIPLEDFRGQWLAATAQHGRIGPAGTETDTTAVYLVCARPFVACQR